MSSLRATLLGTGTSTGVPVIGCPCAVCSSKDPRDRRLRCSAYIVAETAEGPVHLLIDTGPDFRQQALTYGIERIDGVLYTHHHFDHIVGVDDLRPYCFNPRTEIPCFANAETAVSLLRTHGYIFEDGTYPGIVKLSLHEIDGPFSVGSRYGHGGAVSVTPIPARHGAMDVLGFRIGRFAYLTDVNVVPDESLPLLEDLDVLILDGLREKPHETHFTFAEATGVAQRVGAKETYFIHMTHTAPHAETDAALPEGIHLAYDGLTLYVEDAREKFVEGK